MESRSVRMEGEVSIDVPPAQLFRLWRNVVNLPALLSHVAAVERLGGRRSRWTVRGPGGAPLAWEMEADEPIESERLAWHSVPGAPNESGLSVSFTPVDDGAATRVHVDASHVVPMEGVADAERTLGPCSLEGIAGDLARLKRRIEAGETVARDSVDETSAQSFPASDPPAWTLGRD